MENIAHTFKTHGEETIERLLRDYGGIRTGRATPQILDSIEVDSYGTRTPLRQIGSLLIEDARTLRLSIWDQSQVKTVEKAIIDANLGLSVVSDDKGIRVIFPELTSDRREQLLKLAKSKLEDARVSIRQGRDDAMKGIDTAKKEAEISEDDAFRQKTELQKTVDSFNQKLETMFETKEAEITL